MCTHARVFQGTHEMVRAVVDHYTREPSLLAFKKGEVIRVVNRDQYLQKGKTRALVIFWGILATSLLYFVAGKRKLNSK